MKIKQVREIFAQVRQQCGNNIANQSVANAHGSECRAMSRNILHQAHYLSQIARAKAWVSPFLFGAILSSGMVTAAPAFVLTAMINTALNAQHALPIRAIGQRLLCTGERAMYRQQQAIDSYSATVQQEVRHLAETSTDPNELYLYACFRIADESTAGRAHNCMSMASSLLFALIENNADYRIEQVGKLAHVSQYLDHAYLILNRNADSELNDLSSWNNNAVIACPWYNVCITIEEIKKAGIEKFTKRYPLLNMQNKEVKGHYSGQGPVPGYAQYQRHTNTTSRP